MRHFYPKKFFKRVFGFLVLIVAIVGFFLPLIPFLILFPLAMELLGYPFFTDMFNEWYAKYKQEYQDSKKRKRIKAKRRNERAEKVVRKLSN